MKPYSLSDEEISSLCYPPAEDQVLFGTKITNIFITERLTNEKGVI
jgi:hypothetical protein